MKEPYPQTRTMLDLMGLRANEAMLDPEGEFYIVVDGEKHEVSAASLAELERRGWVEVADDKVRVTDRGHYWCKKWSLQTCGYEEGKLTMYKDATRDHTPTTDVSKFFYGEPATEGA